MATLSGYVAWREANGFEYDLPFDGAVTTAKVLEQIVADAAMPLYIIEIECSGQSDTADAMQILVARYSAKSTSGTSGSGLIGERNPDTPASTVDVGTGDTGTFFTSEGTQTDVLIKANRSVQAGGGFFWSEGMVPSKIFVPSAGIIAVKSNITIT